MALLSVASPHMQNGCTVLAQGLLEVSLCQVMETGLGLSPSSLSQGLTPGPSEMQGP